MSCGGGEQSALPWNEIVGRQGVPVYRVRVPVEWERTAQKASTDTTQPIAEFFIEGEVRVVVHNFPGMAIPPGAQIARWKGQFEKLDPAEMHVQGEAWGGFSGLAFTATGLKNGKKLGVLGWAMQLAPEHTRVLSLRPDTEDLRADYTIKAVGPEVLLQKHQREIVQFAHSFELIREVANPL